MPRPSKLLLSPKLAQKFISDTDARIIDIRDVAEFNQCRIPGATNGFAISKFMWQKPKTLKEVETFVRNFLMRIGIDGSEDILVYEEDHTLFFSATAYFLMDLCGVKNVRILHGGLRAWRTEGLPTTEGEDQQQWPVKNVDLRLSPKLLATKEDVKEAVENKSAYLIDVRDEGEWKGKITHIIPTLRDPDVRAGRIPDAIWIPWGEFAVKKEGSTTFRGPAEVRALMAERGLSEDDPLIVYCYKGARASNALVALKEAGFKNVRNFLGSWDEWGRDESCPLDGRIFE